MYTLYEYIRYIYIYIYICALGDGSRTAPNRICLPHVEESKDLIAASRFLAPVLVEYLADKSRTLHVTLMLRTPLGNT